MDSDRAAVIRRLESLSSDNPPPDRRELAIGEMARLYGVSVRTLRFYESKGLLAPRRRGGTRLYGPAEHERLALLLKAKRLGFTLAEIGPMLGASEPGSPGELGISRRQCFEQIRWLEQRRREIEAALAELRRTYSSFYARIAESAGRDLA